MIDSWDVLTIGWACVSMGAWLKTPVWTASYFPFFYLGLNACDGFIIGI